MDNYERMEQVPKQPQKKFLIIGYVSLGILFALIITYCILSPSIFSGISLGFMLVGFTASISTPYYVNKLDGKQQQSKGNIDVIAFPVQRIVWALFLAFNLGVFGFKLYVCITATQYLYTTEMQQFLQIQSYLFMFLPLILLPFILGSLCIRTKTRKLSEFKKRINRSITIPVFLIMGLLLTLIEIFSISLAGLLFFLCLMSIYVQRKLDFNNIYSRMLVSTVQLFSFAFITGNFITTTSFLQLYATTDKFRLFGINGLHDFMNMDTARGYVICLILLFIISCIIQRIFVYSHIWAFANRFIELQEIAGQQILFEQGIRNMGSIDASQVRQSQRSLNKSLMVQQSKPQNRKVRGISLQQYEMQSVRSSRSENSDSGERKKVFTDYDNIGQFIPPQEEKWEKVSKSTSWRERKSQLKGKKSIGSKILDSVLWGINEFVNFIYSTQFALRATEILSIIVIQRYNNIYSFVALIWLAIVASVQNIRVIFYVTLAVLLPVEFASFVILFVFNAPDTPLSDEKGLQIYGFQTMQLFWLDIIIFNVYLFYMITFILSASTDGRTTFHRTKSKRKPSFWVLALAFVYRYTYLFTILAIFFLGFSDVNLINLFYVIMFLVFFSLGENVITQKKTKHGKQITVLNTFSRKYWFVIIYYTLLCIIGKYVYFLFFPGKQTDQLEPTGINKAYDWGFNFSLSDICKSNTTPFFIIFILSEGQIMIYRSTIYLYYSFSIVSQSTEVKEVKKNRTFLNKVLQFIMEFYYQSLYIITGIIIIFCNYRWSFFGAVIMITTCWLMLKGVSRKGLATVVILDLAFLFTNYIVLFIDFKIVQETFGENAIDVIEKISLFLGLILNQGDSDLYSVFALNIVIFYFSVESYRLANLLVEERFKNIKAFENEEDDERDSISQYENTVIDSEMRDFEFAQNYNNGVILITKKYYETNLWQKYKWWYYICKFFAIIITDAVAIFVLVCCLYFRLSVSMFYFLLVYMIYYLFLFDQVGILFINSEFYNRVGREMTNFKTKEAIITDRANPQSMLTGEETTKNLFTFMDQVEEQTIQLKYKWKEKIWFYSSLAAVVCLILTYCAQFTTSQFYIQYIHFKWTENMESILFVLGISADQNLSFFRSSYFYYVMVIIAVIERLLLKFTKRSSKLDKYMENQENIDKKSFGQIDDPAKFIDTSYDFIQEVQIHQPFVVQAKRSFAKEEPEKEVAKQANILIYFEYKRTQIQMNMIYGFMMALIRFYLLMMLINLYEKSNIFAFAYLFAVLFFWFKKVRFQLIKNINKAAIIILCMQYLVLLLDINNKTSAIPLPNNQDLSLLQGIFSKQWIDYLLVNFDSTSSNISTFLVSFLISSIIIFLTQIYFALFFWVSKKVVTYINQVYDRYQYITWTLAKMPKKDTIYLNYENYKNFSYRFMKLSYELFINNSYIVVSMLILILLSDVHTIISAILVFIACIYIYMGIFTDFSEDANINSYTSLYFQIIRLLLFAILVIVTITQIPVFDQTNSIIVDIQKLQNLSQIFLLFFIQIWLDLSYSTQFKEVILDYNSKVKNRENVLLKCMAYQQNIELASSLIQSYKEILSFEVNIIDAMHIIKQWHKMMSKNLKHSNIQILRESVQPQTIQVMRQQIRTELSKRPQDDESILEKFKLFINKRTHTPLKYRYYEIMRYIVYNNHRVINAENAYIDIWDYILQNYEKLDDQIQQAQIQLQKVSKAISSQPLGDRMNRLQLIKQAQYSQPQQQLDKEKVGIIQTPQKIFINIKEQKQSLPKMIMYFILSNFSYFLTFFLWIYYLINPCLLSLPFIIYIFAYELIADRKLTALMLLYIFCIIVTAQVVQLSNFVDSEWIKYLFLKTGQNSYNFVVGYLYFLFIMVFINEEINKYKGTKFRFHSQVQSKVQGALRMLINEDPSSKLYLWKMKIEDEDVQERECNPMQYFSKKIQSNPQQLTGQQVPSFFETFNENKVGIDLYPLIATVQIFITLYLIFFYPLMVQSPSSTGFQQTFKYFQFSSDMVIAVLVHVFNIVLERRLTLSRGEKYKKEKVKYFYTMLILTLFCLFIYYISPRNSALHGVYEPRPACIAFAFFYFIYFFLSGLQIRFGYKKYKSLNSVMTRRRNLNNIILVGFTSIPFLVQLKTFMDFSFCETSLKIFDWFRLFAIYYSAFKAKLQYYGSTGVVLGQPLSWLFKLIGWLGFIGILLIIFAPMVLFSGLNPIAQTNLVVSGSLSLGIQIKNGNYFELYETGHFSTPPVPFDSQQFYDLGFNNVPQLSTLTSSDIPQQFQEVNYQPFSDSTWGISQPNLQQLIQRMQKTIEQKKNNQTSTDEWNLVVKYVLNRRIVETVAINTNFYFPSSDTYLDLNQLQGLYDSFTICNSSSYFPDFYISLIRLNTVGSSYKPRPINYKNSSGQTQYKEGVLLTLFCTDSNTTKNSNNVYWGLNVTKNSSSQSTQEGVTLFVYCDKYQNLIGGLGFTALYTSVILVVANLIRSAFNSNLPQIPYYQNPKPDNILQICEAIGTLRVRKQYREQYLMFYELIDIIRSPQIIKYMSGSYPVLIEEVNETRKRKLLEKQRELQKKKIQ